MWRTWVQLEHKQAVPAARRPSTPGTRAGLIRAAWLLPPASPSPSPLHCSRRGHHCLCVCRCCAISAAGSSAPAAVESAGAELAARAGSEQGAHHLPATTIHPAPKQLTQPPPPAASQHSIHSTQPRPCRNTNHQIKPLAWQPSTAMQPFPAAPRAALPAPSA